MLLMKFSIGSGATGAGSWQAARALLSPGFVVVALMLPLLTPRAVEAQVRFDDCQPVAGGGISCNTVPYGNTRTQMIDGEYGLLDQASPGWAEYDPYEGYEDMLGGNQT